MEDKNHNNPTTTDNENKEKILSNHIEKSSNTVGLMNRDSLAISLLVSLGLSLPVSHPTQTNLDENTCLVIARKAQGGLLNLIFGCRSNNKLIIFC
jgi:hypothetical protein